MSTLRLESPWEKVKELMMEAEPSLTEEDLVYEAGNDDALIKKVATKMNRSIEDTKGWIESVSHTSSKAS